MVIATLITLGLLGGIANARAERREAQAKAASDAARDQSQQRSRTASERRARKERQEAEERRAVQQRAQARRQRQQQKEREVQNEQRERRRELARTHGTRQRLSFWRRKKGQVFAFNTGRKSFIARLINVDEDGLVVRDGAKTEGHVGFKDMTICPMPAAALKNTACWLLPQSSQGGGGGRSDGVIDLDDV